MKKKYFRIACLAALFLGIVPAHAAQKIVDVMVVYSTKATTVTQGKDIPALAASFIESANQTYKNSNVDIKLRLVHLDKVSISGDTAVSSTALTNLARDTNVAKLRNQYGADLVVLLTLRQQLSGGFVCGIGYVPQGNNGKFYSGAKYGGFSVSAVNCGNATFVHELGHNMGLGHSFAQDSVGGVYSWGRGHGKRNNFATTMAYPQAYGSAVRVQQFSSPNQNKCNGQPCGVPQNRVDGADAVFSLNSTAEQVATFFPTKVKSTVVNTTPKTPTPKPTPKTPIPPKPANLAKSGSFNAISPWRNFWGLARLNLSKVSVASGSGLIVSNRQAYYAGPVQTLPLKIGETYHLKASAALATSFQSRATMRAALLLTREDGRLFVQNLATASIVKGQWSELEASFTVSNNYSSIKTIELLFYGPPRSWNFYLDEVLVTSKSS